MGAALKFKTTALARQSGELARIKVMRGPDFGSVYVLTGGRATIGVMALAGGVCFETWATVEVEIYTLVAREQLKRLHAQHHPRG